VPFEFTGVGERSQKEEGSYTPGTIVAGAKTMGRSGEKIEEHREKALMQVLYTTGQV